MAGVYKAGTLYVDVVPSMKGFFKTVEADAKAQMPNIGQNAGKDFANGLRSGVGSSGSQVAKSLSQPLDAAANDVRNSVNSMAKGLQASTGGMQQAAAGAGRSLSTMGAEAGRARGPVDSTARALDGAASSAGAAAGSMREVGSGFSSLAGFAQNAIAPLAALAAHRDKEVTRGVNLVGAHRDELSLVLGGMPVKGYASHGESWSVALALRLGAFELLSEDGETPVLILDDVFAELDTARREGLAAMASRAEQAIITCAVEEDIPAGLDHRTIRIRMDAAEGSAADA